KLEPAGTRVLRSVITPFSQRQARPLKPESRDRPTHCALVYVASVYSVGFSARTTRTFPIGDVNHDLRCRKEESAEGPRKTIMKCRDDTRAGGCGAFDSVLPFPAAHLPRRPHPYDPGPSQLGRLRRTTQGRGYSTFALLDEFHGHVAQLGKNPTQL